jgi:rhamnose transport system substrate-binding protein
MTNNSRRAVVLAVGLSLVLTACGTAASPSPSAAPSAAASTAPSAAASEAPSVAPSAAAGSVVGYLPKDIVNPYFEAAKTGIDKAVTELGGAPVTTVGPNVDTDPAGQVPFITDLTTQKVNAIIISADDKDAVVPSLTAARAAGIKVVGFDSSPAVGAYDVFVNQVDFSGVGVLLANWACELAPDCTGEIAILSAAATATNQNQWIELMNSTLTSDPKFANLKLVDTVYGNDDTQESTTQAQALLQKYPNLKVIVSPTTVGIAAAAKVVKDAGSAVKVTGLGFPHDMKPYVLDGTSPVYGLWSVPDLGYLSYYVADMLVKGTITGAPGETFTVKGLNEDKPYTIGPDSVVTLGPAFRFDSTNVDTVYF